MRINKFKITILPLIFISILLVTAFSDDILKKLQLTSEEVQDHILLSIKTGRPSYPYDKCKHISMTARAEIVKGLAQMTKKFTKTEIFKNKYIEWWK